MSASLDDVAGANRLLLGLAVVVVAVVVVVVVGADTLLDVVVVVWGAFTEKVVPVSTVTSAPPSTMDGL